MRPITDEDELQTIIARRQGFVVNVWPGDGAIVHNLEHPCWPTQHQLAITPNYPTYFAETRQEINNRPYLWGREELRDCPLCEQKRQRRR